MGRAAVAFLRGFLSRFLLVKFLFSAALHCTALSLHLDDASCLPGRAPKRGFFLPSPLSAFLFHSSAVGRLWAGLLFSFITMLAIIQRRRRAGRMERISIKRETGRDTRVPPRDGGGGLVFRKGARGAQDHRRMEALYHFCCRTVQTPSIAFSQRLEKKH
jgi:hypothetical protein